jgi:multidrug efflux system membrane fusion protein
MNQPARPALPQFVAFALLASLASLPGCRGGTEPVRKARAVIVRTAVAVEKSQPIEVRAVGRIVSNRSVALRAQVAGALVAARFVEGQVVAEGQVLLQIDPRPYETTLAEARAAEAGRLAELASKDLVGKQEYETLRATAAVAEAGVAAADAAVKRAELNLSWCSIRAPNAGRTGRLLLHPGNLVAPERVEPLVTIEQIKPVYASFAIPERHLALLRARGKAPPVRIRPSGGGEVAGVVDFVDNAVDPTTGTILLKARIANDDEALWPGQIVDVTVALAEREKAVVVPTAAISQGQQGDYLFVVKADKTVELRTVKVDQVRGDEALVATGLVAGETVVVEGQLKLVPGATVESPEPGPEKR